VSAALYLFLLLFSIGAALSVLAGLSDALERILERLEGEA